MILVDTSLWVDHLNSTDPDLEVQLQENTVLMHPFVLGEIAMGHLSHRRQTLIRLTKLPQLSIATPNQVMRLVEEHRIWGTGIGYVDAHLVASTLLVDGATLWTRDRRLAAVAERLGVAHQPLH